jgi:hypothetical protein
MVVFKSPDAQSKTCRSLRTNAVNATGMIRRLGTAKSRDLPDLDEVRAYLLFSCLILGEIIRNTEK